MNLEEIEFELNIIEGLKPKLDKIVSLFNDIIIIGNGGSNSIASHISQDYTKVLGKRAFSFSDPSRLTCYINDYGRDSAYVKFLEHFCNKDTLTILISSSGNSDNIINAAKFCEDQNYHYISLSGFSKHNKLNTLNGSTLKYWTNSSDYGVVECCHQIFLHSII